MVLSMNPKVWKTLVAIFFFMTLFFGILFYFSNLFVIFLIGMVMMFITEKIIRFYSKKARKHNISKRVNRFAALSIMVLCFVFAYFLISYAVSEIGDVFSEDEEEKGSITSNYLIKISSFFPVKNMDRILTENNIKKVEDLIFTSIARFVTSVPSFLLSAVLIIPLMFGLYFKKKEFMIQRVLDAFPKKYHSAVENAITHMRTQLRNYLDAKIIESVIIALISTIGFLIIGVKGAIFLGIFAGVLNIVPFIGPLIGAIPAVLIALLQSPATAIWVLVVVGIAQLIDNLYIIPFMISGKVKMDSLLSIILLLVGAQ